MNFLKGLMWTMFCLLTFAACQDQKVKEQAEITAMKDTAIAIHDRVMPDMGKLMQLAKKVSAVRDSLLQDSLANSASIVVLDSVYSQLKSAEKGMMMWMRQYRPLSDTASFENAKIYMKDQIEAVRKVEADMLNSMKIALEVISQ